MTINRYGKTLLLLAVFFANLFLFSQHAFSYTNITVETQSNTVYQGQPVSFIVGITGIEPFKGDIFYRPAGIRYYQRLPVILKEDGRAVITLPPSAVVSPGIEYYIQVADASGNITTSPLINAHLSPHTLQVLDSTPMSGLNLVSPDPAVPVRGETLLIVIEADSPDMRLKGKSVTIVLDDTDITDLADITEDRITFSTPLVPEAGEHTIMVSTSESTGAVSKKSWTFRVGAGEKKRREVYAHGGLSFNYGNRIKDSSGTTGNTITGNMNLAFGVKGDELEATWNGVNIQYIKDNPGEDITISSGFHFTLRKGEQFVEYGDITINETPLTALSFARRGIQAKLKGFNTELHLFDVSTETVSGWKSGIGSSGRRVYGLSLKRALLKEGGLPVTFVYITGENRAVSGFNTAGTLSSSKGDIAGVELTHTIHGVKVGGEVAGSRYDANTSDDAGSENDTAATVNFSTALGRFSTSANYYRYGSDFASIANPNFTADREGVSGSMSTSFGLSTVSLSVDRRRDNVEGDSSRPVVYSTTGTAAYGIAVAPWPSVNVSYSHSMQNSRKEPADAQEVKNTSDTLNMSLAKSGEKWHINLSGDYGRLNDEVGDLDSETRGIRLSGNYAPLRGLSLSPSASLTESKSSGVLNKTRIAALTANIPIRDGYAYTNFQVSYTINDASDGSRDSTNLNGSLRLSMNIHGFVKKWVDYGSETLALTAGYSRINDNVNPSGSGEDVSVFLSLNLFAPIDWTRGL